MSDEFKGTTVNERLYLSGLLDDFDAAIHDKDLDKAKEILRRVELTESDIDAILIQEGLMTADS